MRVRLADRDATGRAVDLRDADLDPSVVLAAVRDRADHRVACPLPGPAHEHVGLVGPATDVQVAAALAAAARSRGREAPQDDDLAAVRAELGDLDPERVDLADARQRVAAAGEEVTALRERVARLGGRIAERRERDADVADLVERRREATRRLSSAETERVAAEQALQRARERAREHRDRRERRLRLADRADNLRRRAREHLAAATYDEFVAALDAVPGPAGGDDAGDGPGEYRGDHVTAALAVARVADLAAPVVLCCDRFDAPTRATSCLDAPVLLV